MPIICELESGTGKDLMPDSRRKCRKHTISRGLVRRLCWYQTTCISSLILLKTATAISLTSHIISRCVQAEIGHKLLDYKFSTA
jgi:hypothetical protein